MKILNSVKKRKFFIKSAKMSVSFFTLNFFNLARFARNVVKSNFSKPVRHFLLILTHCECGTKKAGLVSKLTSSCVAKDSKRQKRLEIANFLS